MGNYLIIGASSGIGLSTAKALVEEGHSVFGTYNNTEIVNSSITYQKYNVLTDTLDTDSLPERIDGIVYCPGSINLKPFKRIKPEQFVEDFNLQVVGVIKVLQALLPRLKKSPTASIVLFSTVAVKMGFTFHTQVATSKGAIEGLAKSLAAEFAPTIRVNVIAPSLTDTPLANKILSTEEKKEVNGNRHPLKRIGQAIDIASMVQFLLSEKSSWMTGQVLSVDGGMSTLKV